MSSERVREILEVRTDRLDERRPAKRIGMNRLEHESPKRRVHPGPGQFQFPGLVPIASSGRRLTGNVRGQRPPQQNRRQRGPHAEDIGPRRRDAAIESFGRDVWMGHRADLVPRPGPDRVTERDDRRMVASVHHDVSRPKIAVHVTPLVHVRQGTTGRGHRAAQRRQIGRFPAIERGAVDEAEQDRGRAGAQPRSLASPSQRTTDAGMIECAKNAMLVFETRGDLAIRAVRGGMLHRREVASHRIRAEIDAPPVVARESGQHPESESTRSRAKRFLRTHRVLPLIAEQHALHRGTGTTAGPPPVAEPSDSKRANTSIPGRNGARTGTRRADREDRVDAADREGCTDRRQPRIAARVSTSTS